MTAPTNPAARSREILAAAPPELIADLLSGDVDRWHAAAVALRNAGDIRAGLVGTACPTCWRVHDGDQLPGCPDDVPPGAILEAHGIASLAARPARQVAI